MSHDKFYGPKHEAQRRLAMRGFPMHIGQSLTQPYTSLSLCVCVYLITGETHLARSHAGGQRILSLMSGLTSLPDLVCALMGASGGYTDKQICE